MKKHYKVKWIKALESGKYKQGRNLLKKQGNKFCCLGVLLDNIPAVDLEKYLYNNTSYLDEDVKKIVGLKNINHVIDNNLIKLPDRLTYRYSEVQRLLADLNDEAKWNFKKIAAFIKEHIKGV